MRTESATEIKVPSFSGAYLVPGERLPYYTLFLEEPYIGSFQLLEPEYGPFTEEEARPFSSVDVPSEPEAIITAGTQNQRSISLVHFSPIRKNPQTGQLEKLTRFSYAYSTGSAPAVEDNPGKRNPAKTLRLHAPSSVLSSGDWYRLGVTTTGLHKIDRAALQAIGINPQTVDPRKIRIYGNATGMLPQPNVDARPDDLVENAILVEGEADGTFNPEDYILFYARGPHTWTVDPNEANKFTHQFNLYADTAYYFITVGQALGKRVQRETAVGGVGQTISSYDERWFHENDLVNMVQSGREWYGEKFDPFAPSRTFTFPASDLVPGSKVKVTSALMGNSPAQHSFAVKLNDRDLGVQQIAGRGGFDYHPQGVNNVRVYEQELSGLAYTNDLKVTITFNQGGNATATGYLNYLEVQGERALRLYGNQTSFRSFRSLATAVSTFSLASAPSSTRVWEVTDPRQPRQQEVSIAGATAFFTARTDSLREFVAFAGNTFPAPVAFGKVPNQNLHRLNLNGQLDVIILTHPLFRPEAERLADHRRARDNMEVEVVTTRQVYNEFSSGAQDVTAIRDFLKMIFDRSKKGPDDPLYLLLLGDASYDYKNRLPNNTNFVPVYQSRQSLDPVLSYSSEDYYGFMDHDEGYWDEQSFWQPHLLDIGIGRLPAQTLEDARTLVQKIIRYDAPAAFGKWRNRITFVADDGDFNEHLNDAENLVRNVESKHPAYNANKVYLDLYRQESVPNGQRSPDANAAIDKAVEQGSLVINYTGHGGVTGWAGEQIVTVPQVKNWKNADRLTFMLTATCEFGRYDDPRRPSGAEYALLNMEGGAVGLLTTTRPVYSNGNRLLNLNFIDNLFRPINNRMPRLGDLMQITKNKSFSGVNNRNFALLGDPSQTLAYPELRAVVQKINGKPVGGGEADTLRALSKFVLEGAVTDGSQSVLPDYNGQLQISVYEKPTLVSTLGNENPVKQIQVRENLIYDGLASIRNGLFTVTFVVPKDISYSFGLGKISLYASNLNTDAHGASQRVVVGGFATGAEADNTPPRVKLFMDDESFVFGGITGTNSLLISKLFDESGINTSGIGIGHEITATLDGNKDNLIALNEYYTADMDSYQSGQVRYLFKELSNGPHTIKVKAWDTYNNSAEEEVEFIVASSESISLEHVLNYPNPFSSHTTFHFDHNRNGDDLDILIQIFTISGRLVKTIQSHSLGSSAHIGDIKWDGKDDFSDPLAKGVYVYKVNIRSQRDGSTTYKFEKLVILN
ncbi:type IX secretion system sortase PorU [soil metagenome]